MVSKLLFIPRHETSWSKMEKIIEYLKSEFNCEILVFSKELDKLIKNKYKKIKIINYKKRNLLQIFLHYIDSICEKYLDDSNFFFFEISTSHEAFSLTNNCELDMRSRNLEHLFN